MMYSVKNVRLRASGYIIRQLLWSRLSVNDLMISESAWDPSVSLSPRQRWRKWNKKENTKSVRVSLRGRQSHSQESGRSVLIHSAAFIMGLDFYYTALLVKSEPFLSEVFCWGAAACLAEQGKWKPSKHTDKSFECIHIWCKSWFFLLSLLFTYLSGCYVTQTYSYVLFMCMLNLFKLIE